MDHYKVIVNRMPVRNFLPSRLKTFKINNTDLIRSSDTRNVIVLETTESALFVNAYGFKKDGKNIFPKAKFEKAIKAIHQNKNLIFTYKMF